MIDPYSATFEQGSEFLVYLHNDIKAKYSTVAAARSALSAILPLQQGNTFGKDPIVNRVLKGMFRERPSLPKHMYDTIAVLRYIRSFPTNKQLLLEQLTKKLVILLCILNGQRSPSIACLCLDVMHKSEAFAEDERL